jgi:hypothetical protein
VRETGDLARYAARLGRAAPEAVEALARALEIPRGAAAEAFAAAGALVPAAVSRRARRRSPEEALAALRKYGRPGDLGAPSLAVGAHLARPGLSPRLGGLLGADAPGVCAWLAARSGVSPEALGRALAASAPLALGALLETLEASPAPDLAALLAPVTDGCLGDPRLLADPATAAGRLRRRLRRAAMPWLARVLAPA